MTAFFSGANFIIDDKGQTISLASRSKDQRIALRSRSIWMGVGLSSQRRGLIPLSEVRATDRRVSQVGRHLKDGDMMLSNRQPTLHKPGILAHKVTDSY